MSHLSRTFTLFDNPREEVPSHFFTLVSLTEVEAQMAEATPGLRRDGAEDEAAAMGLDRFENCFFLILALLRLP